jgi:hypothetical protein
MALLFAMFSNPARPRLRQSLRGGPLRVGAVGRNRRLQQIKTSKHLVLRAAGSVSPQHEGAPVHFAISEPLIFGLGALASGEARESNGRS